MVLCVWYCVYGGVCMVLCLWYCVYGTVCMVLFVWYFVVCLNGLAQKIIVAAKHAI